MAADEFAKADRRALLAMAREGFERAASATGIVEQDLRLCDRRVRLRFAGPTLAQSLLPALAHLQEDPSDEEISLTLHLWDSVNTGTRLPLILGGMVKLWGDRWWEVLDPRQQAKEFNDASIRTAFFSGPGILNIFDADHGAGFYWVRDGSRIPYYECGSPCKSLLCWWLESRGFLLMHSAAIGDREGCVLVPGKGGSGKSSTALACLESGLKIIGDDYCIVESGRPPQVHSLYSTSKLKGRQDLEIRFPNMYGLVSNIDNLDTEKALLFLDEHMPEVLLSQAPLKAILLPKVTGEHDTHLRPSAGGQALRFLAPSTMFQFPGDSGLIFRESVALIRRLPVWELCLGTDLRQIPEAIRRVLKDPASLP